jgi:hypothetical protein
MAGTFRLALGRTSEEPWHIMVLTMCLPDSPLMMFKHQFDLPLILVWISEAEWFAGTLEERPFSVRGEMIKLFFYSVWG